MKTNLKSEVAAPSSELVRCFKYLEEHGGRLTRSHTAHKWPDGTVTAFAWQYSADSIGVIGAKTAIDAIRQHRRANRRGVK